MIEFAVSVQGQRITCEKVRGELVSGLRGVKVHFTWSGEWQQLRRIAVFRAGSVSRNVMDLENECEIPWEVLVEPGPMLMIGIQGTNEEGTVVTPTLEAEMGEIQQGADPSTDPTARLVRKWLNELVENTVERIEQLLKGGQLQIDQVAAEGRAEIQTIADQLQGMIDGEKIVVQPGEDGYARTAIQNHQNNKNNPHEVDPVQIGAMAIAGGKFTGMVLLNGLCLTKGRDYGFEVPEDLAEGQVYLVEDTVDNRIVEYGRKNGWHYLKIADGTAACWKTDTRTIPKTAWRKKASGQISFYWTSGMTVDFPYPFQFTAHPAEFMSITNGTNWDQITHTSMTNQQADKSDSYRLVAFKQPDVDVDLTLSLLAVGRWK